MSQLDDDVTWLLETFQSNWNAMTPLKNKELWDLDEQEPYYIAEEIEETMYGWDVLDKYWGATDGVFNRFEIDVSQVKYKLLTDDIAALNFLMHWDGELKGYDPEPIGFDVKVSLILRRKAEGWRICHYVESALGPLPYLKKIYRQNVRDSFRNA